MPLFLTLFNKHYTVYLFRLQQFYPRNRAFCFPRQFYKLLFRTFISKTDSSDRPYTRQEICVIFTMIYTPNLILHCALSLRVTILKINPDDKISFSLTNLPSKLIKLYEKSGNDFSFITAKIECSLRESNPQLQLRRLLLYPFN